MTNAEKKAWLRRYRQALDNERRLRNAIRAARSRAEATTQALRPQAWSCWTATSAN